MASGFFAVLDDIAALMDDVAVLAKVATKKTSGILGDDLAVNAEKSTGFVASRELPVLWKITVGSFVNKLIILPIAFVLSYFYPPAIVLILVLGGLFLAYEGGEKIVHVLRYLSQSKKSVKRDEKVLIAPPSLSEADEKTKVKSAIFTDFILSIEIVIIALGTVVEEPILTQILVVSFVAILATVGVYGLVALIVRMDDFGFYLIRKSKGKGIASALGNFLVWLLPKFIKLLAVLGVIALFLVSGEIFLHNVPGLHHFLEHYVQGFPEMAINFAVALVVGLILALAVSFFKPERRNTQKSK
jgi:predicted DNA repair protein MutK